MEALRLFDVESVPDRRSRPQRRRAARARRRGKVVRLFELEPSTLEPFLGDCPTCRAGVLAVDVFGAEVVCEVAEVLPAFPCPSCAQVAKRGHERSDCARCGKTGVIGDLLPLRGVAVAEDGSGRIFKGGRINDGEAAHRFHVCRA